MLTESSLKPGFPSAGGWHGAQPLNGGILTYISASYFPDSEIDPRGDDVYGLSHEIAEWMDDPFIDNFSPGWNIPFIAPSERCHSGGIARGRLEVADPAAFFNEAVVTLPAPGFNYHVTEAMFIDFFTRSPRSRSVNGQYSMFTIGAAFGLPSEPSSECVGSVQADERQIEVPGSLLTSAQGINTRSDVVGFYVDSQNRTRGFEWEHGSFRSIDFPGARRTHPSKINDAGEIVGFFFDGSGRQHGFSYINGQWNQIDYPGARATAALGINSAGQIVGGFLDPTQPILHGFSLLNGHFVQIDTPFGLSTEVDDINDLGQYVGEAFSDRANGPYSGFVYAEGSFSILIMPTNAPVVALETWPKTVNNGGTIGGNFSDSEGYSAGFVRLFGYLHEVNTDGFITYVNGANDLNQIVGDTFDFNTYRWVGYIGALPLKQNVH